MDYNQLKDSPELRDFHFAGTGELLKRHLLSDDFKEIQPGNYNLVYTGELSDIKGQEQRGKLNAKNKFPMKKWAAHFLV